MATEDSKPGAKAGSQGDELSATGMFLNAFQVQSEPSPPETTALPGKPATAGASPGAPGEFTQLFGALNPAPSQAQAPPARRQEPPGAGDVTRIFAPQPAPPTEPAVRAVPVPAVPANPPRMKGFSSPGASDSASAEGSFTQLFRSVTPPPAPAPRIQPTAPPSSSSPSSPGVTELFRALSSEESSPVDRGRPPEPITASPATGSVTEWIHKLSQEVEAPSREQAFEQPAPAATPAPSTFAGHGEYTRIISGGVPAPPVVRPPAAAVPAVHPPAIEPPKVAAPRITPPAVAAPAVPAKQTKLQEMLPILLVLNAFLLVVLILVVIFALTRK